MAAFVLGVSSLAANAAAIAAAPDPGGDEEAFVPVPPPAGQAFGFNDHAMLLDSRGVSAVELARITAAAGANIQRITVNWQEVEPEQDVTSEAAWDRYEAVAAAFRSHGQRLLITLSPAPNWARDFGAPRLCFGGVGCAYPPSEQMLGQWQQYVAEIVRRFPDAVIETWNEPNIGKFWAPAPDPGRFARLHAATYAVAKAVDPSTIVLAGGLAGTVTSTSRHELTVREFLRRAYASGRLDNTVEALSIHLYTNNQRPMGEGTLFAQSLFDLREARNANGDGDKKIWVTETGLSTSGDWRISPERQADGLIRRYKRLMTMDDVDGLIIHTALDQRERQTSDRAYGFGVVANHSPLVVKPAYCEFAGRASSNPPGGCKPIVEVRGVAPGGEVDLGETITAAPKAARKKARSRCRSWSRSAKKFQRAGKSKRRQIIRRCVGRYLLVREIDRQALKRRVVRKPRKACGRKARRVAKRKRARGRGLPVAKRRALARRCTGRRSLRELNRLYRALV